MIKSALSLSLIQRNHRKFEIVIHHNHHISVVYILAIVCYRTESVLPFASYYVINCTPIIN